jgi:hypothetical protein
MQSQAGVFMRCWLCACVHLMGWLRRGWWCRGGAGWGAHAVVKIIDDAMYEVVVVSPRK